jgi:tRNA 2-thiocytidine biosynthesis protein TtcA
MNLVDIPANAQPPAADRVADPRKAAFEANKLGKRLHRQVGQAIADFNMIEAGDKVMVCLSGGKDSYSLLDILLSLRQRAPVPFELMAVNLDQKQPGFPADVLPDYLTQLRRALPHRGAGHLLGGEEDIPEGKTMCSLCSRLRRGILYRVAGELGATKIALGHHRDDMVVTLLMNMFFGSRLKGMPPKLVSDDGRHVVIRPLAYVAESDLERWAVHRRFPIIPCTLCGSQDNLQRVQVKKMIHEWEKQYPGRIDNMLTAMGNVVPSHLMDRKLYPFTTSRPAACPTPAATRPSTTTTPVRHAAGGGTDPAVQPPADNGGRMNRRPCCFALATALLLAGCAGLEHREQRRQQLRRLAGRARAGSYAFERLPSQQAQAAEADALENAARRRCRRPASYRRRPGRSPTCWCSWARASRAARARPGTTRCGGAVASVASAAGRGSGRPGRCSCSWSRRATTARWRCCCATGPAANRCTRRAPATTATAAPTRPRWRRCSKRRWPTFRARRSARAG